MQKKSILLIVNLLSLILFLCMLFGILNETWLTKVDTWINLHMHQVHLLWLTPLVEKITDMNGFTGAAVFSVIVIVFLSGRRWYDDMGFFVVTVLGATGLFGLVKFLVARARPHDPLIEIGGFSFPSGHTTMATAMAFSLYFIARHRSEDICVKGFFFVGAMGWGVLIALSRLYLEVHWFTDVVGGFALGVWWVTLLQLFREEGQDNTTLSHGSAAP